MTTAKTAYGKDPFFDCTMTTELNVKRYAAYYHGWCLAFGEHELNYEEEPGIHWVFGPSQVGFVVDDELKKRLFKELLGQQVEVPEIRLAPEGMTFNEFEHPFSEKERRGAEKIREFIRVQKELHMFLTSHFCYPPRTRIITLAPKKPPIILYKEIEPLRLRVV